MSDCEINHFSTDFDLLTFLQVGPFQLWQRILGIVGIGGARLFQILFDAFARTFLRLLPSKYYKLVGRLKKGGDIP
jgi:hypothetical protein